MAQLPITQSGQQTRYREFSYTIAAGATVEVNEILNYFRVINSTITAFKLKFGDDPNESDYTGSGLGIRLENIASRVFIKNNTGSSGTVTFAVAIGWIDDSRLNVSGTVTVTGTVAISVGSQYTSTADATTALSTVQTVIAQNTSRKGIFLTNVGSTTPRIGDASVTTSRGTPLLPNQTIFIETTAAISAIATGGWTIAITEVVV